MKVPKTRQTSLPGFDAEGDMPPSAAGAEASAGGSALTPPLSQGEREAEPALTPTLSQRERETEIALTPTLSQRERETEIALTPTLSQGERETEPALTPTLSQGERETEPALTPTLSQGERETEPALTPTLSQGERETEPALRSPPSALVPSPAPLVPSPAPLTPLPQSLLGQTVWVVDSHSLIHQVFHALPEMTSPKGEPVGAVFGFTRNLLYLLEEKKPDYLFCAFDLPGKTFRHAMYVPYKMQRAAMHEDLVPQIPAIRRVIAALGLPALGCPSYEADDILATIAERPRNSVASAFW